MSPAHRASISKHVNVNGKAGRHKHSQKSKNHSHSMFTSMLRPVDMPQPLAPSRSADRAPRSIIHPPAIGITVCRACCLRAREAMQNDLSIVWRFVLKRDAWKLQCSRVTSNIICLHSLQMTCQIPIVDFQSSTSDIYRSHA